MDSFSVFEELQLITKQHFSALEQLARQQGLPVLQQQGSRAQAPGTAPASGRVRTSSYTHPQHASYSQVPDSRTSQAGGYGQAQDLSGHYSQAQQPSAGYSQAQSGHSNSQHYGHYQQTRAMF